VEPHSREKAGPGLGLVSRRAGRAACALRAESPVRAMEFLAQCSPQFFHGPIQDGLNRGPAPLVGAYCDALLSCKR